MKTTIAKEIERAEIGHESLNLTQQHQSQLDGLMIFKVH